VGFVCPPDLVHVMWCWWVAGSVSSLRLVFWLRSGFDFWRLLRI
jgi:hypothetical protein